ncbi:lipid-A-disaccharide synthase [candidate division KSB1 bacterium]|nr:lipid-A-disaccharide synthase [candidate division KSB1 bacterium]
MSKKIMIIAGEASGDHHGGALVRELNHQHAGLEIFGVGGDSMQSAGMELFYHIDDLAVIGFVEILKHYFYFRRVFYDLLAKIETRKPDLIILIDYPGFNLRFARQAKKRGAQIFYFIAPQVWAWARGRAKKMARYIDRLVVFFEFETDFFNRYGLDTHFVGHPLLDQLNVSLGKEQFFEKYHFAVDQPLLVLLPGSRKQEVNGLLPAMLQTAKSIQEAHQEVQVAVGLADTIRPDSIRSMLPSTLKVSVIQKETYALMKYGSAGMVASGTATLETACWNMPFAILYRVAPMTYFLGKRLVKIPHIGLANVVAGERVAREFIQDDIRLDLLVPHMEKLLFDHKVRQQIKRQLSAVREKLGSPGAIDRTARLVWESLY